MSTPAPPLPKMQVVLLIAVAPFPVAILMTIVVVVLVGDAVPRQLAPGESLTLAGLGAALLLAGIAWQLVCRRTEHPRARRGSLLFILASSLMAWPVLTIGVMPTVNGARLGAPTITAMSIERLEITYASRSRGRYHWAHLRPPGANASLRAGRYFVSEAEYTRWSAEHVAELRVTHARGALGAEIILEFR